MNFVHPTLAMVGLAAVSLPIIIHLLIRRRVRPVRWAAMKFLLQAYKQRRRRLILEQLLLLAARCLLVALIALAIGRLALGTAAGGRSEQRATSLVLLIDDSLTAAADGGLERSKARALSLLSELDPGAGDTVSLVTLSTPATGVVLPPSSDVGAVRTLIEQLSPTDASVDLAGAISLVSGLSPAASTGTIGPRVVVAVLSEFLAGSVDVQRTLAPIQPAPDAVLISEPRPDAVDNVAIVGLEPLRSVVTGGRSLASSNQARITLRRFGPSIGAGATRRVRLFTSENEDSTLLLDEGVASFEPGQIDATMILSAHTGPPDSAGRAAQPLICQIDADALPNDDILRRTVEFRDSIRVAIVSPRRFDSSGGIDRFDSADWVTLALEPIAPGGTPGAPTSDIQVSRVEPGAITSARLAGFDAAVLCAPQSLDQTGWESIGAFAREGGLVVIVPPAEAQTHVWTDRLSSTLALPWDVSREAIELDPPGAIQLQQDATGADLLALVGAEIPELARAVTVRKALRVETLAPASATPSDAIMPLTLGDGSPFLVAARPGTRPRPNAEGDTSGARGLVVLLASSLDLEWTDLPAKPLVVPIVQEVVRQGVGISRGTWSSIAGSPAQLPTGAVEVRLLKSDDRTGPPVAFAIPPSAAPSGPNTPPIRRAGLYRAIDAGGATRAMLAVTPDHRASETGASDPQTVLAWLSTLSDGARVTTIGADDGPSLASALRVGSGTRDLSTPLIGVALALAIVELLLARWSSHARQMSDAGVSGAAPALARSGGGAAA